MDKYKRAEQKGREILTTEQCPRCRHPLRKNPSSGEKICGNCGYRSK